MSRNWGATKYSMDDLVIRELKKEDLKQVQELTEQLNELYKTGHDISINAISNTFRDMEDKNKFYINFVAQINDQIVGFISSIIYKTFFHPKGTLLINELIIDKNQRGKKIGERLLKKLMEIGLEKELNEIEVGTTFANKQAIEFYKKNGLVDESILLGKELNR